MRKRFLALVTLEDDEDINDLHEAAGWLTAALNEDGKAEVICYGSVEDVLLDWQGDEGDFATPAEWLQLDAEAAR